MFFRPTSSKLDQAKQAARDAASAVSGAAGTVAGGAHSLLEKAPKFAESVSGAVAAKAGTVGEAVAAKAGSVGETLSGAREVVAAKVDAVRNRGVDEESVLAAQSKAATTRHTAEIAAKEAERAARDAQKKAEVEISRAGRELASKRAEFERNQAYLAERAAQLSAERAASQAQAAEIHARLKNPVAVVPEPVVAPKTPEIASPKAPEVVAPPVFVAPPTPPQPVSKPRTVEIHGDDDGFEYQVVAEKEGGSKLWLLVGGAVFIGAALVYFFAPGSGRRSRAAIKDRLAKVKDDAVDKVTGASDAAAMPDEVLPTRIAAVSAKSSDKLNEVIQELSTPAEIAVSLPIESPEVIYEEVAPAPALVEPLSEEIEVASSDAVEGVAVEAYAPLGNIETAGNVAAHAANEEHHPNIFDKVAEVVGNIAGTAEHLAGEKKDGAQETAEEIEAAAQTAREEARKPKESAPKKKK